MANTKHCPICNTTVYGNQIFCSKRHRYKFYHNKPMVLTLKKQWFNMILSGEKHEEYREIKPYWETRFLNYFGQLYDTLAESPAYKWNTQKREIVFRNGYGENKPEFTAECTIREDYGKQEWGAEKNCKYYVLTIHNVYNVKK